MSAGYSDSEDRLWLRFGSDEGAVQLWMTRRLLSKALPQIWSLMAKTCALPPDMAKDPASRQNALLAEREVALEVKVAHTTEEAREVKPKAMAHRPVQGGLMSRILAERSGRRIKLNFLGSGGQVGMICTRAELHRMLNLLVRRAEACGWQIDPPWRIEEPDPSASS